MELLSITAVGLAAFALGRISVSSANKTEDQEPKPQVPKWRGSEERECSINFQTGEPIN